MFCIDEDSPRVQRRMSTNEERAFGLVPKVMDRERGDDCTIACTPGGCGVIAQLAQDLLIVSEALLSLHQHGFGVIDQVKARVGKAFTHKCGEQSGSRPKVEHMVRVGWKGRYSRRIEGGEAGNQLGAAAL